MSKADGDSQEHQASIADVITIRVNATFVDYATRSRKRRKSERRNARFSTLLALLAASATMRLISFLNL